MRQVTSFPTDPILAKDAQLLQIVDAALADAALRAGEHLVCRPGCTQCCHGTFAINALDAARLRSAMADLAISDPEMASRIKDRAQQFLDQYGADFPGDSRSGILASSPEAEEAFGEYANEAPCPALDPESGTCDLYEARPVQCRVFGPPVRVNPEAPDETDKDETPAFALCELCFTRATPEEIEAAEMFVPREEEESLLREFQGGDAATHSGCSVETIVAFCLRPAMPPIAS